MQHVADDGRRWHLSRLAGLDALRLQALVFVVWVLRLTFGAPSAAGASAPSLGLRHAHHLLGDAVCFLLVAVSGRIYPELCLDVYAGDLGCTSLWLKP